MACSPCLRAVLVGACAVVCTSAAAMGGAFGPGVYPVDPLPVGNYSYGMALSNNGQFVAGTGGVPGGNSGIRWSRSDLSIDVASGLVRAAAYGVSNDGSVVAGSHSGGLAAFRWTAGGGVVDLGPIEQPLVRMGMSGDGNTIVARRGGQGSRWRNGIGWENLPGLTDAVAITPDANVIVGRNAGGAAIWRESTGTINLPTIAGGAGAESIGVSASGNAVVGRVRIGSNNRAFRWTEAGGMENLGTIAGAAYTTYTALSCSFDGNIVIGTASGAGGGVAPDAFVWTPATGMIRLRTWLNSKGISTSGFTPLEANSITPDGQYITGFGGIEGNLSGWYVYIPAPGASGLLGLAGVLACRRRR